MHIFLCLVAVRIYQGASWPRSETVWSASWLVLIKERVDQGSNRKGALTGRNKTRDQRPEPGTKIRDQILSAENEGLDGGLEFSNQ